MQNDSAKVFRQAADRLSRPPEGVWCVYILHCADGSLYTGISNDLDKRLLAHHEKRGARYTRGRLPFSLVYVEIAADRSQASRREAQIKKLKRLQKISLIYANAG